MMGDPFLANLCAGLAALLLMAAAIANGLLLFRVGRRWSLSATAATVGAVIALVVAMAAIAASHAPWWQSRQAVLGLALATLTVHLVLAGRRPIRAVGLLVDLLALVLVLLAAFMIEGSGPRPECHAQTVPLRFQWVLFLVGTAGLMVASGAGLTLALRARLARRIPGLRWSRWIDLHSLLKRATELTLISLGAAIVIGLWWSWRLLGVFTVGMPGEGWAGLAWVVAVMSYLARRTGGRWGRWAAGLLLVAAAVSLLGLLAGIDLL